MHLNALRSLTQPCMTTYCIYHYTHDPGIPLGSANQCTLEDVYLRSNLARERGLQQLHLRDLLLQQSMHSPDLLAKVLPLVFGVCTHHQHQCNPPMIIPLP